MRQSFFSDSCRHNRLLVFKLMCLIFSAPKLNSSWVCGSKKIYSNVMDSRNLCGVRRDIEKKNYFPHEVLGHQRTMPSDTLFGVPNFPRKAWLFKCHGATRVSWWLTDMFEHSLWYNASNKQFCRNSRDLIKGRTMYIKPRFCNSKELFSFAIPSKF